MTLENIKTTITNLQSILPDTEGLQRITLSNTIFDLQNKQALISFQILDSMSVSITEEEIQAVNNSVSDIQSEITSVEEKTTLVNNAISLGKKILSFIP